MPHCGDPASSWQPLKGFLLQCGVATPSSGVGWIFLKVGKLLTHLLGNLGKELNL